MAVELTGRLQLYRIGSYNTSRAGSEIFHAAIADFSLSHPITHHSL